MNISCRGRNRTCERQINNLPSVPAHKPYKIGGRPKCGPPPSLTRETATRFTARRHAVFRIVRDRGRTCALGSGGWIRTNFERFRAARPAVRRPRK